MKMVNGEKNWTRITWICSLGFWMVVTMGLTVPLYSQTTEAQSVTVEDLLNKLHLHEANIQDYKFIISRSFYHPAYDREEAKKIADTETNQVLEESSRNMEQIPDELAQKILLSQLLRERTLSGSLVNGNLLFFEGIGITTWKYSICSFNNFAAQDEIQSIFQAESFSMPTQEEVDALMRKEPNNELTLKQVLVNYPEVSIDSFMNEKSELNRNVFKPNKDIVVRVRDKIAKRRSIEFPFWHESFLNVVDNSDISMISEGENRYRLIAAVKADKEAPQLTYELVCDADGNAYEVVYKRNGDVHWKGTYLNFMNIDNGGVRVPQVGMFWRPEYIGEGGPRLREATEIHTLLSASVNRGKSMDDLSINVPEGSKVIDERPNGTQKTRDVLKSQMLGPDVTNFVLNQ